MDGFENTNSIKRIAESKPPKKIAKEGEEESKKKKTARFESSSASFCFAYFNTGDCNGETQKQKRKRFGMEFEQ